MDLGLKDKTVIVTAASKGLGKATALEFAAEGAKVIISSRHASELEKAKADIISKTNNSNVQAVVCDMTKAEDIKKLVQQTIDLHGTVDVLINNTGGPPAGRFDQFSDQDWYVAFELNLLSFIRTIREVLPFMRKQQFGRIVNFASSAVKQTLDDLILSNTLRAGIVGLAKSLSQELGKDNILINTLNICAEEVRARMEQSIPLGRYGEPEEFARVAVFLGSSANTYVTGQTFVVDGGMVKAY